MSTYNPFWLTDPHKNLIKKIQEIPKINLDTFNSPDSFYYILILFLFFFFILFSLNLYLPAFTILFSGFLVYFIYYKYRSLDDNTDLTIEQKLCRMPTKDNPYMNPNILDAGTPNANLEACKVDELEIRKLVDDKLNKSDSLYDRDTSYRFFYTLPVTSIPGDQIKFAKFLYGNGRTCRSDQNYCSKYHDLRYQRENPDIDRMVLYYTE